LGCRTLPASTPDATDMVCPIRRVAVVEISDAETAGAESMLKWGSTNIPAVTP
jgi:hypothetical protein